MFNFSLVPGHTTPADGLLANPGAFDFSANLVPGHTTAADGLLVPQIYFATVTGGGGGTAWTVNLSDTVTVSDDLVKAIGLAKSDTVTITDSAVKTCWMVLGDTVTITDDATKSFGKTAADTVTITDDLVKSFGKGLADVVTVTDLMVKAFGLTAADTVTITDNCVPVLTPSFPTQYSGFRTYYGGSVVELCLVAEADAPAGMGGAIKIRKGGVNYAVYLVETGDSNASSVRVRTSTGTKSVRLKT